MVAVVILLSPDGPELLLAFPLGLVMFFADVFRSLDSPAMWFLDVPLMIAPYVIYVLLLSAILCARKWRTFGIASLLLLCILLLNVAGCRTMIKGLSRIQ